MEKTGSPGSLNAYEYVLAGLANPNGRWRQVRMLFYGNGPLQHQDSILEALQKQGLMPSSGYGDSSIGFGIVFFDTLDDGLLELTTTLVGSESVRLLGVSTASALNTDESWALLDSGFSDLITWNDEADSAHNILVRLERWNVVEQSLESTLVVDNLIGCGLVWKNLLRRVIEVARFTDASILILGDSGTGKELIARLIHTLDRRTPRHELVITDCSTIVPELSGSEFFGHKQGAYTGAVGSRRGAFQIADGGTLFLDEVGELPLGLQSQLLRVVQEGSYKRVGGNQWRTTNFRLICATNRDLRKEVEKGHFRTDLYYRLADWVFELPLLSERPEDILPLTRHFLAELNIKFTSIEIDDLVGRFLLNRTYPGNVRELRQLVRRIGQRHVGTGPISIGDIPEDERPENRLQSENWRNAQFHTAIRRALALGLDLKKINQFTKDTAISIAVDEEHGNLQKAARKLGVTDRMLQMHRKTNRQ